MLADIALQSEHPAVGMLPVDRRSEGRGVTPSAIVRHQRANRPGSGPSSHASSEQRVYDATRKEEVDGSLKVPGIFEEERTLFREVHLEALIDGDLRVVGLHLAEVWIPRQVKRER